MESHHTHSPTRVHAYLSVLDAVRQDLADAVSRSEPSSLSAEGATPQLKAATIYNRIEQTVLKELVDATPIRRLDESRAALELQAIEAVLSSTEWLTGDEVGTRHNPKAKNKHAAVSRWLSEGKIFAIERRSQRLFARYQFDESWQPLPVVVKVLRIFQGYSPFRVAGWFESTSAYLDGRRPREVVQTDPSLVLEAARDHVAGPLHG